MNKTMKIC